MKANARVIATAALMLSLGMLTGCNQLKARDQLTKGVAAFKNAQYEQAINHFQQAIAYDPNYNDAKLYLATAYSYPGVPNLESADNMKYANKAITGFKEYLADQAERQGLFAAARLHLPQHQELPGSEEL